MSGKKYVIDGLFLTQPITGIQRYAFEITNELDKIAKQGEIEIAVPQNAEINASFTNIPIIRTGKTGGLLWEQTDYARYLRKNHSLAIGFTNVVPLLYRHGVVAIHDISYKVNPSFFVSAKDRLSALWHRLHYLAAAKSDMEIITVSNFSKGEIQKYYSIPEQRIHVAYDAWQHMENVKAGEDTFAKYPMLKKGAYYFAMASLMPNKNFKWIVEAARSHPNETFAIAGSGRMSREGLSNLFLLGYVSDADAKTLMAGCKAFLFPTLYEGFGIPPLEAIACGAPEIIVSDTPCMHEVYGDAANYLNPDDAGELIVTGRIGSQRAAIERYSWAASAKRVYDILTTKLTVPVTSP